MGDLVGDDVGDHLEVVVRRQVRVDQERGLAEGDRAQVLHGAEREVGDGDQVELVARVGQAEVLAEEPQRMRRRSRGPSR